MIGQSAPARADDYELATAAVGGRRYHALMTREHWRHTDGLAGPPTYAERLDGHWAALPLQRKARVLLYLAWRLVRIIPYAVARQGRAAIEAAPFVLARIRTQALALAVEIRRISGPEQRQEIVGFIRSLRTFRAAVSMAPLIASMLLASMFTALRSDRSAPSDRSRPSIVEQARLAQSMRPPPCYLVDGEIWIDAEGGPIRPRHRNYLQSRQEICGF